ncbi:hypothetical protein NUITMVP1_09890 [Proteus mirabilis]|nr:hypothetical protein NUITMVP1_09890 [Proteus mirabilis]
MLSLSFPLASVTKISIMKIPNTIKDTEVNDIQKIKFLTFDEISIIAYT